MAGFFREQVSRNGARLVAHKCANSGDSDLLLCQKSAFNGDNLRKQAGFAYFNCTSMFRFRATKAQESAVSSIVFEIGLPAPCPALVSIRISTGAWPA